MGPKHFRTRRGFGPQCRAKFTTVVPLGLPSGQCRPCQVPGVRTVWFQTRNDGEETRAHSSNGSFYVPDIRRSTSFRYGIVHCGGLFSVDVGYLRITDVDPAITFRL
jgi:hypothetical protein